MISLKIFKMKHDESKDQEMDKRSKLRAKSLDLVKTIPQGGGQGQLSNLINLSETGLQFFSKQKVEPDTILQIMVNLSEKKAELVVKGKVVWTRPSKTGVKGFYTGVCFVDVDDKTKSLIHEFVHEEQTKYQE